MSAIQIFSESLDGGDGLGNVDKEEKVIPQINNNPCEEEWLNLQN